MNKKTIIGVIGLIVALVIVFFLITNKNKKEETEELETNEITATVLSVSGDTLTVQDKDDIIYNKTHMSGYYKERMEWEIFFNTMLYYLKDCYTSDRLDKIEMVKEVSKSNLIKMVVLTQEILKYIKSNGNIDLILDKFVIEMRKYYE